MSNYITIKQLSSLASQLNIDIMMLSDKLQALDVEIKGNTCTGFKSNRRRHILELYR